jgi:zinc transporter ZupT
MLLPLPSLPLPTTALSQISASFLHHNPLDDSALSSTADLWQPLLPASWQPLLGCSIPKIPIVMSLANAFHSASDHIAQSDRPEWFFPLLLSCMAGASTCVGAAVVFCFSPTQIQRSMSFSLSLAASVMMTVSCISIAPECWHGIVTHEPETADVLVGMPTTTRTTMIVHWWLLVERLLAFGLGCGGYVLLSKLLAAMPDPEHLFLGSSKPLNANDVRPLLEDGEVHDEELRDEPTSAKMKRSPSLESYQSGDSFDSFYDDEISDDDIEMVSPVKVGPTKTNDTHHSQNHRMRRKLTTQSTTASLANDNHRENCAATSGENDPSQEDVVPYDKDASAKQKQKQRSWRVAMLLFFSLLAHNFPEGLCVVRNEKCYNDLTWKHIQPTRRCLHFLLLFHRPPVRRNLPNSE